MVWLKKTQKTASPLKDGGGADIIEKQEDPFIIKGKGIRNWDSKELINKRK